MSKLNNKWWQVSLKIKVFSRKVNVYRYEATYNLNHLGYPRIKKGWRDNTEMKVVVIHESNCSEFLALYISPENIKGWLLSKESGILP